MKYLKTYESVKKHEILQNIEDICLELNDNGFSYHINKNYRGRVPYESTQFDIEIRKGTDYDPSGFKWSEIEDVVERLKSYLIPIGYDWSYDSRKSNDSHVLFKTDDIYVYNIKFK
jgi:hypothetical protein